MTIDIRLAQPGEGPEWDALVAGSPHGTLFHHWNWLRITERHTRTTLYPIIGMKGNSPIGVFPLFFQKRGPSRMVFSPPPHAALFYLGPALVGYDTLKQEKRENNYFHFQEAVARFIRKELQAHYISISLPPSFQDPRPFIWAGYSFEPWYDYVIDLTASQDDLIRSLDKKQRQNLARAGKRGFRVELGGRDAYEKILTLMDIRYAEQGKNVTPSKQYLMEIFDAFRDNMRVFVADIDGEVVSGSIDFQYRDTHFSWIGNPKPSRRIVPSPNDILIWESVRYAQKTGMKSYVTMNAAGNKRLHSYYASKFNPSLRAHFSLKKTTMIMKMLEKGYSGIKHYL